MQSKYSHYCSAKTLGQTFHERALKYLQPLVASIFLFMLRVKNETAQHTSVALPVYGSALPQRVQLPAVLPALPVAPWLPLEASCPRNDQVFLCEDSEFLFKKKQTQNQEKS